MKAIYDLTLIAHKLSIWLSRAKLRRQLLDMNERALEDIGYSRALLEQGVNAWPWRIMEEEWTPGRRAVAELKPHSDRALRPLVSEWVPLESRAD